MPKQKSAGGAITQQWANSGNLLGGMGNFAGLTSGDIGALATTSLSSGGVAGVSTLMVNNSKDFNVRGDLVINNPVAEPASDSLYNLVKSRSRT
jgi:hypothetical protein